MKLAGIVFLSIYLSSCAILHHVQVGDIDSRQQGQKFEVLVSETGINVDEAGSVAKSLTRSKAAQEDIESLRAIISLFQQGPRTGNPVYVENYADYIREQILVKCPSGRVANLMSIRESNKYPVVSGEIVKITGTCFL